MLQEQPAKEVINETYNSLAQAVHDGIKQETPELLTE
jgi:hypothetical protein